MLNEVPRDENPYHGEKNPARAQWFEGWDRMQEVCTRASSRIMHGCRVPGGTVAKASPAPEAPRDLLGVIEREGAHARRNGQARSENPYQKYSAAGHPAAEMTTAWFTGWDLTEAGRVVRDEKRIDNGE